jgi:hypothetical protein
VNDVLIPLGGKRGVGFHAVVDETDRDLASARWWNMNGYAVRRDAGSVTRLHRVVAERALGHLGAEVDHIDGDTLNNRRSNLRLANRSQQTANSRRHTSTGHRGIAWDADRQRWRPEVWKDGKRYRLGRYRTLEEAVAARTRGALRIHGEFALEARP